MRPLAIVLLVVTLTAAGCGGGGHPATAPKPPKLPRALAQSWAQQADAVAAAVDAGDGCTALQRAETLRTQVVGAVNAHRVPRRYLEPLVSTANDLAARITCTPPAPAPAPTPPEKHGKPPKHEKHGKHGGD
jgi:hypothetical protein